MSSSERSIFIEALEKQTPLEVTDFLRRACGDDAPMRRRVEALLRSHARANQFLETPAVAVISDAAVTPTPEEAPDQIGPYKLLEKIGEGGMGAVYMAEQQHPVRRRVALKLIKPGMDSALVIARFEAERQALAMMDHVNIAKVLDAGATPTGRPYFVMELVHGAPITRYCDENNLPLPARLELFVQVCRAVQHAHQKGVIHRDLKPSNILVTLYDTTPVPKVIDFGVAKAVEQRLTERTLFTHYGTLVGTFEYMAPEQAEMNALGVDTRSDVYSLGVLLYELLTGTTPLESNRVRGAAFNELLRVIREEDAPRPSLRLSTMGEKLSAVSAHRSTHPQKLARLVRGELDWIVMRCIDKDRARRYDTANGLATDVLRYLRDEPVEASPPSRLYALRKFARRHKVLLATTAAVAAALVVGSAAATYGLVDARRGRRSALDAKSAADQQRALALANASIAQKEAFKANEVSAFLKAILAKADPDQSSGSDPTVREVLDGAVRNLDAGVLAGHPEVEGALRHTIGAAYLSLGLKSAARPQLDAALELQKNALGENHPDVATTLYTLAELAHANEDWRGAADLYARCLKIRRMAYGEENQHVAVTLSRLADAMTRAGDLDAADVLHAQAVAMNRKVSGERSLNAAAALNNRAIVLTSRRDWAAAEALFREARDIYREVRGPQSSAVVEVTHNIAICRVEAGDDASAEPLFREALAGYRKAFGPEHPSVLWPLRNLRLLLLRKQPPGADEAASLQMEVLRLEEVRFTHEMRALPNDSNLAFERGSTLGRLGRFREALADRELTVRLKGDHLDGWFALAVLRLYLGDVNGYRQCVREMAARFAGATDADSTERVAKALLLAPPDGADASAAVAGADNALAARHAHSRVGWFELTKALAEYRAGREESCLRWLETFRPHGAKINFGDNRYPIGTAKALEAMARHHLGHIEAAHSLLAEAEQLAAALPEPGKQDLGYGPENWCVFQILLREARSRITPDRPARPN